MIGLIVNDLYNVVKNFKVYFVFVAVFAVCSFLEQLNSINAVISFYVIYAYMLMSMIPMSLYSLDEQSHWCAYSMTLPVSRREYVSGKYVISIICVAFNTVVWLITRMAAMIKPAYIVQMEGAVPLYLVLALSLFVPALSLPITFKFGSTKSRFITIILVGAFAVVVAKLGGSGLSVNISSGLLTALMYIVPFVLFAVSWVLSIRIYEKKEL